MSVSRCSSDATICVLVVLADTLTANLLTSALGRQRQFTVIHCTPDLSCVLQSITNTSPDVVIVGANLPHAGIPLLRQMRKNYPSARPIVLLEASKQRHLVPSLFQAGTKGIFDRSKYDIRMLGRCIRCVAAGQIWATSEELGLVMDSFAETPSLQIVSSGGQILLTNREKEVVQLVAEGCGNREVAQQLGLSEHTVKNYLFNLFEKLGISSRAELVMYVMAHSDNNKTCPPKAMNPA